MKKLAIIFFALLSLSLNAQTNVSTPIRNGILQTPLNGNGQSITNATFTGNGGGITNLNITNIIGRGTNFLLVMKSGNDATGNRVGNPFLTITAARDAAQYGDTIFIYPGTYSGTAINKNGVTLWFAGPSCIVSNFADDTIASTTNAIITDRLGATNINIIGFPTFIYNTGTNLGAYDPDVDLPGFIGSSNGTIGIYITNAATIGTIQINELDLYSYESGTACIVANCSRIDMHVGYTYDRLFGQSFTYNSTILGPQDFTGTSTAYEWATGEMHLNGSRIFPFSQYGIWCEEPNIVGSVHFTNNFYAHFDEVNAKIYVNGVDQTWRNWFTVDWVNCSNSSAGFAADFFGGFNYVTAKKISDTVVGAVQVNAGATLWLNAQKISSPVSWITMSSISSNVAYITAQEYEDTGSVNGGITNGGGTLNIFGGVATNKSGLCVGHGGGKTILHNLSIDTSLGGATNDWPLYVTAPGLTLDHVTVTNPASAFSIYAPSAQTVGNVSTFFSPTASTKNITMSPLGVNLTAIVTNTLTITATGLTNTSILDYMAYVTDSGQTLTYSDGVNTHAYTSFSGTLPLMLHQGYSVSAASGLTGFAVITK